MTILRKAEYRALQHISLAGSVIDLGGDARSEYHSLFKGNFSMTVANLGGATKPDITLDLEQPLPMPAESYDCALLINVLEHIFEYRQLLRETARVLRPQGRIVIVVPFLFPYHPSPNDYHRYTSATLQKSLSESGFTNISIVSLGTGVCAVRWVLIERLLPRFLRPLSLIFNPLSGFFDRVFTKCAQHLGKKYNPSDYALGYVVTGEKP